MIVKHKLCYSHLVYLMLSGEDFEQAINNVQFSSPNFAHEGLAGYIEVDVTFDVKDLKKFAEIYLNYYELDHRIKQKLYTQIKTGLKCY